MATFVKNVKFTEASKKEWNSDVKNIDNDNPGYYPGDENIKIGCLQRIAASTEAMAKNYQTLINERDMYKRWYLEQKEKIEKLIKSNAALKGHFKRLKKQK